MTSESTRDPSESRTKLVNAAFAAMYRHGFQGARVDQILQQAGMTKGAFYHHFKSKQALGYAVLDEVVFEKLMAHWDRRPLADSQNAIDVLVETIRAHVHISSPTLTLGCPLNNLAQEMSPLDAGFKTRIAAIFDAWVLCVADILRAGQARAQIKPGIDAQTLALYLVAAVEGCIGMGKQAQNAQTLQLCMQQLIAHLESLRN